MCIKDLDKLNLVYGGLVLGSSPFKVMTRAVSKNVAHFKTDLKMNISLFLPRFSLNPWYTQSVHGDAAYVKSVQLISLRSTLTDIDSSRMHDTLFFSLPTIIGLWNGIITHNLGQDVKSKKNHPTFIAWRISIWRNDKKIINNDFYELERKQTNKSANASMLK